MRPLRRPIDQFGFRIPLFQVWSGLAGPLPPVNRATSIYSDHKVCPPAWSPPQTYHQDLQVSTAAQLTTAQTIAFLLALPRGVLACVMREGRIGQGMGSGTSIRRPPATVGNDGPGGGSGGSMFRRAKALQIQDAASYL